jgi:ectoine hydroxylase-related dioxygenase (phytanoyl-CoA dioxygenase family)
MLLGWRQRQGLVFPYAAPGPAFSKGYKMNPWRNDAALWRRQYETDGYLVVEDAVDEAVLAEMKAQLDRIEDEFGAGTLPAHLARHVHLEKERSSQFIPGRGGDTIGNIMELPLFAPVFRDVIVYPRVLDVLEALFGSSEFAFHNYKCIPKMPGGQVDFRWHRDLPYLQHSTPNLITCMLCLDAMTIDNGATVVCPGSHRVPPESVTMADTDMHPDRVPAERAPVVCPAGSAVLFHVNIVHGGGPNRTEYKRRNVIGIWSGPDTYPITSARYAYQGVMPRSTDPGRRRQIELTFAGLPQPIPPEAR